MLPDKLPLVIDAGADADLQGAVEALLASSLNLLTTTGYMDDADPATETGAPFPSLMCASRMPSDAGSAVAVVETLQLRLDECCELLRRVEGERRYYYEKVAELQAALKEENGEQAHMRFKIAESHAELRKAQRSTLESQKKVREMEAALNAATEEQMHLRRFLRSTSIDKDELLLLVPDRRFEEAFRDKMSVIRYKRRYDRARFLYEQRSERIEGKQMEMEDAFLQESPLDDLSSTLGSTQLTETLSLLNPKTTATGRSNSLSLSQPFFMSTMRDVLKFPFILPFSHATPQDGYIKTQLQRSVHRGTLNALRDGLFRLSLRLKQAQDVGLRGIHGMMLETLRFSGSMTRSIPPDTQKAFESIIEKLQHSHRELLFQLVELVNSSLVQVVEEDNRLATKPTVSKRDVGCSAYIPVPLDVRQARFEIAMERQRRRSLQLGEGLLLGASQMERNDKEMLKKAKLTLEQLINVHKALSNVVTTVRLQSHPNEAKLNDLFQEFSLTMKDDVLEDPRYETKITEAVEEDVKRAKEIVNTLLQRINVISSIPPAKKTKSNSRRISGATAGQRQVLQAIGASPRGGSTEGRRPTVDALTTTYPVAPRRSVASQRGLIGDGGKDNTDVEPNTVDGVDDGGSLKKATNFLLNEWNNSEAACRSKRAQSLTRASQGKINRPSVLSNRLSSQKITPSNVSTVNLPQFAGNVGGKY